MAKLPLTDALHGEYEQLFDQCRVRPEKAAVVDGLLHRLQGGRARYETVGQTLGIPWHFIAVIHCMEASFSFDSHLHNGDPLSARTRQVPAGRPKTGNPPFRWEDSAIDALQLRGLDRWADWSAGGLLYQLEGYNGWGYRLYHQTRSPYLWSFSNHYSSGKYVADGKWSSTAVSKQCGAAVLLHRMAETSLIAFADRPIAVVPPVATEGPLIRYSGSNEELPGARALQQFLNQMPGIFVKVDGKPGQRTSDAFKQVTGHYLVGDPRA